MMDSLRAIGIWIRLEQLEKSGVNTGPVVPSHGEGSGRTTSLTSRRSSDCQQPSDLVASGGLSLDLISERLNRGGAVTRGEAASFLRLSSRTLQRMEAAGRLSRCPGLGTVVRYPARDVLKLASAL